MMSDNSEQARLGDSDDPVKAPPDKKTDEGEEQLTDFGDPRGPFLTKGGLNRFSISSLLQKSIRRSDEETAAWAAWELARSGFDTNLWNRLNIYVVEDLRAGDEAGLLIARYEELAERWENDNWCRIICAIHAALTAARAHSSRESAIAYGYFSQVAEERAEAAKDSREPLAEFPVDGELELGGRYDVALDRHSRQGKAKGRDWEHFHVHATRVGPDGESELSQKWIRERLQLTYGDEIDEEQIEHAVTPVDPATRWEEDRIISDEQLDSYGE